MGRERTRVDLKEKRGEEKKSQNGKNFSSNLFPVAPPLSMLAPVTHWGEISMQSGVPSKSDTPLLLFGWREGRKDVERRFLSLTHAWTWLNELSARHLHMISNERPFLPKSIITSVRYIEEDMRFRHFLSYRLTIIFHSSLARMFGVW